jgi:hypothetical protein
MNWTLRNSSTFFRLGDVSAGEPQLYCSGSLTDRRYLSRPEHDAHEFQLRAAAAVHLPRLTLMACGAAAVLFGFVALARAEGPAPTSSAGQTTAECARRDLATTAFIEQRGEAGDIPSAKLGEIGLMQLEARLRCTSGQEASALAIYESVLKASQLAERVRP